MYLKLISVFSACFMFVFFFLPVVLAQDEVEVENIEVGSGKPYQAGEGGLGLGVKYYIDRDYVATTMPEELEGAAWIMTANDDKSSVGEDFLKFTVDRPAVVWVAHDSRGEEGKGGTPPGWLSEDSGWEKHPEDFKMDVTDTNMGFFLFWSKEFDAGEIVLGGNVDPPAGGQGSNYIVLLTPGAAKAMEPQGKLNTTWAELKNKR